MTHEKRDDLLRCPFCGGEAGHSIGKSGDGSPWPYVECFDCGATAEPNMWNRRTLTRPEAQCSSFVGGSADARPELCDRCGRHWNTHPEAQGETPEVDALVVKPFIADGGEPFVHYTDYWAMTEHARRLKRERDFYERLARYIEQCHQQALGELSAKRERMFPIMGGQDIPWSMIAPWESTAKRNHGGQSLERLAERGGLAPHEAVAVLTGQPCRQMADDEARQRLLAIVQERTAKREGFVWVPPVGYPVALRWAPMLADGYVYRDVCDPGRISIHLNESHRDNPREAAVTLWHETVHMLMSAAGVKEHDEDVIEACAQKLADACPEIIDLCRLREGNNNDERGTEELATGRDHRERDHG